MSNPSKKVQQTALMKFMEFLRVKGYYISEEMVDKFWELIMWEREHEDKDE